MIRRSLSFLVFIFFAVSLSATVRNVKTTCGATGNGSTNDLAAINTCEGMLVSGDTLEFPAGTYAISAGLNPITVSNVIIDGSNNTASIKATFSGGVIMTVGTNSLSSSSPLLAATADQATSFTVSSAFASGLTAGSLVYIWEGGVDGNCSPSGTSTCDSSGSATAIGCEIDGCRSEVAQVASVSGTTVNVTKPLNNPYDPVVNAAVVQKLNTVITGVTVQNITFNGNTTAQMGLYLLQTSGLLVSGVTAQNVTGTAVSCGTSGSTACGWQPVFNNISITAAGGNGGGNGAAFAIALVGYPTVNTATVGPGLNASGFGMTLGMSGSGQLNNITIDKSPSVTIGRGLKNSAAAHVTYTNLTVVNAPAGYNGMDVTYYSHHNTLNNCNLSANNTVDVASFGNYNDYLTLVNCTMTVGTNGGLVAVEQALSNNGRRDQNLTIDGGSYTGTSGFELIQIGGANTVIENATIGPATQGVNFLVASLTGACINSNIFSTGMSYSYAANGATSSVANTNTLGSPVSGSALPTGPCQSLNFAQTNTCGASLAVNASCTISVTFTPLAVGPQSGHLVIIDNASGNPHSVPLSGTGIIGSLSFNPTSIGFGSQTVGSTSGTITETVTNNGSAAVTGIGVSLTGTNPGDFGFTNNCPASLAINASCTVVTTFTPTTSGSRTANLHFVDSLGTQDVVLTGTGVATTASITISPLSLSFGNQTTGTTSGAQTILVTSSGTATLTLTSIVKGGTDSTQFGLTNPCPATLAPNASCTLSVVFSPTTIGAKNATLTFTDNANDSPQVVNITGTGTTPAAAGASLSTTALTFTSRNVGTSSAAQNVIITNNGTASLVFTSVGTSGDYSQTNNCTTVAVNGTCTVAVTFTPTAIGTRSGVLTLTDNAASSPQTVTLSGVGLGASGSASPTTLTFGNQGVGTQSVAQNVTLSNNGNAAMVPSFGVTGDFSQTNNCSSIPAGTNCNIAVSYQPTVTGNENGTITITSNALNSPQTISMTGTGVQASLSISPTTLPFGNQPVGTTSTSQTTVITNVGTSPASITSITIGGPNNTEFSIITNTCGTLQPSANCHLVVQFAPISIGIKSASISIVDNAPGSPHAVALTGTGTSVIATFSPTSISFGNQPVGTQSGTQTSTLTNSGTASFTITSISIGSGGNPGDFSQTNDCPGTLAPNATCTITAAFLPVAQGNRVATVNVVGNVNVNLPLSGTGTVSGASFSPSPVAFGNQTVATSTTLSTVLTNTGLAPLHILGSTMLQTNCSPDLNDTFSGGTLDGSKWVKDTGSAPGNISGVNVGTFSASNVSLAQGVLTLLVTQTGSAPVTSTGAEVRSVTTYGFGTWEWKFKSASTATTPAGTGSATSGQISSGFNFVNNSQTEIDFEIEGQFPNLIEQTTWFTTATNQETNYSAPFLPEQGIHDYKFVWNPGIVQFFVDGVLSATHTNNVPTAPAFVLMNIWGTNSTSFGGNATPNVARRMFFSQFTHTPTTCGVSPDYSQTNNCPGTLSPSSSCTYNVTFTPSIAGEDDADLQVLTDAPVSPSLVTFTGTGVSPSITLTPTTFSYGNVTIGSTPTNTFHVLNTGTGPAVVSSVTAPSPFSIVSQNCVGSLAAGTSCTIVVGFTPVTTGLVTNTLTVADNAAGNPHTAGLSGTGISSGGASSLILGGAMDAGGNLKVGVQ